MQIHRYAKYLIVLGVAGAGVYSQSPAVGVLKGIVSETGTTWTLRTTAGRSVTVVLTAQTAFGTPKAPKTAADFPVGTAVAVTGALHDGTVTATRVAMPARAASSPGPTASATAGR